MRTRLTATCVVLTLTAMLTGCMGSAKFPTYYTLQVPSAQLPPDAGEHQASVAVREFRSPAYLRQGAIVYRASPEVVGFYHYHRWAVDPREALTQAIEDRLRASGRFALVKSYDGRSDVDYILSGSLEKLEEVDYERGVKVEVALSAQMTDLRCGKTVWANRASEVTEVDKRSFPSVVAEMSLASDRAVQKLLASLNVSAGAKPGAQSDLR